MSGTELKTDSLQRWMMYSKDTYGRGHIFLAAEQQQAVKEGKKFSQRAHADVWAKDAALVCRVRLFLGTNFHWHRRLVKDGDDLAVIQTLQSMIHGESVVLVAEQSRSGGSAATAIPAPPKVPSFRESLMTDYRMSYDAATDYSERYNASVDRINAAIDRSARAAASSLVAASGKISTPLGNAQPFQYTPDALNSVSDELAASTNNPDYAAKMLGYNRKTFGNMIHAMKDENDLRGDDNVIWHDNGDVYFDGLKIDNMHSY